MLLLTSKPFTLSGCGSCPRKFSRLLLQNERKLGRRGRGRVREERSHAAEEEERWGGRAAAWRKVGKRKKFNVPALESTQPPQAAAAAAVEIIPSECCLSRPPPLSVLLLLLLLLLLLALLRFSVHKVFQSRSPKQT